MNITGKSKHKPEIPQASLDDLLKAVQAAHARLLQPPPSDGKTEWKPSVRRNIDWNLLARHSGFTEDLSYDNPEISAVETSKHGKSGELSIRDPEKEPLTIGLVGQPNVGKSSLLNALLGEQRVRASKTPGKVCHYY